MSEHVESTCASCGQTDNHPKHVVHVGSVEAEVFGVKKKFFHDLDVDKDGYLEYHFNAECDNTFSNPDHAHIAQAADGGIRGDDLRNFITGEGKK